MPKKLRCVEPKIGKRIQEYNKEAHRSLQTPSNYPQVEIREMFERHLLLCVYCRSKLDEDGMMALAFYLFGSGYFIEDGLAREKRRQNWLKRLARMMTTNRVMNTWPKLTDEEWNKICNFASSSKK